MLVCEISNDLSEVLDSVRDVSRVEVAKTEETGYVWNGCRASPMIEEGVFQFRWHIAFLS
jgi:hypothetical protein